MKSIAVFFIGVFISLFLAGCGGGDGFILSGTIKGLGTQNLRVIYFSDGHVVTANTASIDGKFRYEGSAREPSIVSVYTGAGELLGRAYVENGSSVEVEWSQGNPFSVKMKGNGVSERWGKFLSDNQKILSSGSADKINGAVAKWVTSHREDPLSAILMMTVYDVSENGVQADSLMRLIPPKVRSNSLISTFMAQLDAVGENAFHKRLMPISLRSADGSLVTYNPAKQSISLLCFTSSSAGRDSIVPQLRKMEALYPTTRLAIVDISFAADSLSWRTSVARDSADWIQCWAVGGVSNRGVDYLSVPRTPYFIVADSSSVQLYRGNSVSRAVGMVNQRLNYH